MCRLSAGHAPSHAPGRLRVTQNVRRGLDPLAQVGMTQTLQHDSHGRVDPLLDRLEHRVPKDGRPDHQPAQIRCANLQDANVAVVLDKRPHRRRSLRSGDSRSPGVSSGEVTEYDVDQEMPEPIADPSVPRSALTKA